MTWPSSSLVTWVETAVPSLVECLPRPVDLASATAEYPYATVVPISGADGSTVEVDVGAEWTADTSLVTEALSLRRETTVRVTVYGSGAYGLASDLRLSLGSYVVSALLQAAEIGIQPVSDIIDISPAQAADQGEAVYQDYRISHVETAEAGIAWIDSVPISGTVS